MNQRNSHPIRDFIGGLLLVLVLHTLFVSSVVAIAQAIPQIFHRLRLLLLLGIGCSQFLYLSPVMLYFHARGRMEVVKGMLVVTFVTLLLSGGIVIFLTPSRADYFGISQSLLLLLAGLGSFAFASIIYYMSKPRS